MFPQWQTQLLNSSLSHLRDEILVLFLTEKSVILVLRLRVA